MNEEKSADPAELKLLGKVIGTFEGWDQFGEMSFVFYDFIPTKNASLPIAKTLNIDLETGVIQQVDDNNKVIWEGNLLSILGMI